MDGMIRYLLDTDIASYFLKKHDMALVARVRTALRANQVAISAVTRAELRYGQALLPAEATRRRVLIDGVNRGTFPIYARFTR